MKKTRASSKKKSTSILHTLKNHPLPAYLALRRQKVKIGPLKATSEADIEFYVCMPDAVTLKTKA